METFTSSSTEKHKTVIRKGRLNGAQRNRLGRLLNMMYTTPELAEELGISARQIRKIYIPMGCPHKRTNRNHIMINGSIFRDWYYSIYPTIKLSFDEAFCLSCRQAVKMEKPTKHQANGIEYWLCDCPNCGRRLSRFNRRLVRAS